MRGLKRLFPIESHDGQIERAVKMRGPILKTAAKERGQIGGKKGEQKRQPERLAEVSDIV